MLGNHQISQNNSPGMLRNSSPGLTRPPPLGMLGGNASANSTSTNNGKPVSSSIQGLPKLPPGKLKTQFKPVYRAQGLPKLPQGELKTSLNQSTGPRGFPNFLKVN